jgi:transposase-like protein
LPANDFALVLGVSPATLYAWSRRFRDAADRVAGTGLPATSLIELVPTEDAAACTSLGGGCDARISLKLRSGRTLRFPSHVADEELRRLIAVAETA